LLNEDFDIERNKQHNKNIRLSTVDNFQGEESKIIISSLVRSNPNGDIGFLKESNRLNVMFTRAKYGMYIISNLKCL